MVLETLMKLCVAEPENFFYSQNKVSWIYWKSWSLIFNYKSHIWENIFPEIWAKILSVNKIAGFFNQLYLQNK